MGFKRVLKKGFLSSLNPMNWVGSEQIHTSAKTVKNLAEGLIDQVGSKKAKKAHHETFEECLSRLHLTEADVKRRMKSALSLVLLCLGLSIAMIGYTVYLFFQALPLSAFVCIILTLVLLAYAFREHFNYFQMKQRRLGCTFKEWFYFIFKRPTQ